MAGFNTRFHDVGFDRPKYLLPWNKKIIIREILESLGSFKQVILVANKRDKYFKDSLFEQLKDYLKDANDLIYIPDTRGQAETAAIGISMLKDKNIPIFIHNADTILKGRDLFAICKNYDSYDGFIDTFIASSNAYSYVVSSGNSAVKIVEKEAISPFASSGLYGFKNSMLFLESFNKVDESFSSSGTKELYISNLIQQMIDTGSNFYVDGFCSSHTTTVLGTPQEYGIEVTKMMLIDKNQ